jgi:hypothetical protein
MARLPEKRRNAVFRVLSRVAGALAVVLILSGFSWTLPTSGGERSPSPSS